MNEQETLALIEAQTAQLEKLFGEVSDIKQALADAQAEGKDVPASIVAAIQKSGTVIQKIDDLNEDTAEVVIDPQ